MQCCASPALQHEDDGVVMIDGPSLGQEDFSFKTGQDAESELRRLEFKKLVLGRIQVASLSFSCFRWGMVICGALLTCPLLMHSKLNLTFLILRAEVVSRAGSADRRRNDKAARLD